MWLTIVSAGLRILGVAGSLISWCRGNRDRQQGREDQQDADLKAQNETLRKERDSLAQPVTGNPFDDEEF